MMQPQDAQAGKRKRLRDDRCLRPTIEIREKYLERAIRELNTLTREIQSCDHCRAGT